MSEQNECFRRLCERRGEVIAPGRDALLLEFLSEPTMLEASGHIAGWEGKIMNDWRDKILRADLASVQVTLANGMVGREYRAEVHLGILDGSFGEHRCGVDVVPGLSYDPTTRVLSGSPAVAGEFDLVFDFRLSESESEEWTRKLVKFIVNHDPKSLWKDEPSDSEDPYWQEDMATGSLMFGGHFALAASKRGRSHAHEGKFRDDAFRLSFFDATGWGIISVSDGAGSSKFSRKGSVLACDAVNSHFHHMSDETWKALDESVESHLMESSEDSGRQLSALLTEVIGKAALHAQTEIRNEASEKMAEIKDYSCTLIFALCKQFPTHFVVASFWVGDGGIGVYQDSEVVHVLGEPDSGEYAGQTRFLTMSDIFAGGAYAQRIKFKAVDRFAGLILMTDGITDPKFQTDANLKNPSMWSALWDEVAGFGCPSSGGEGKGTAADHERSLLDWLDFWSPGNHDDRTIAILYNGTS